MTIDINKLRRLAQAATPGPWYATGKLTRYVEARIDGGLIQEVAACGPTKADGGYGPQQEANARLIAAANPATISELLDRLEAAESEALEEARLNGMGGEREAALIAKLEAAEKERDALRTELNEIRYGVAVAHDTIKTLRAKIEAMERQEPVTAQQRFQRQQEMMAVWLPWQTTELRKGRPARAVDVHGLNVEYRELYALPGAQGEEK